MQKLLRGVFRAQPVKNCEVLISKGGVLISKNVSATEY